MDTAPFACKWCSTGSAGVIRIGERAFLMELRRERLVVSFKEGAFSLDGTSSRLENLDWEMSWMDEKIPSP